MVTRAREERPSGVTGLGPGRLLPAFPGAGGAVVDGVVEGELTSPRVQPTIWLLRSSAGCSRRAPPPQFVVLRTPGRAQAEIAALGAAFARLTPAEVVT